MNDEYKRLKRMVDDNLLGCIPEIDKKSLTLLESMEYSLTSGGKRLRSVIMLDACQLCGGNPEAAIPYACAIEYIQTYSLIHDDHPCMDNDDYRRGKLTNHKVFGDGIAMLAGDGLLSSAHEVMYRDMLLYLDQPVLLNRRVRAAYEIAKGTGVRGMVAGQVADLEHEHKEITEDILSFIHINKTAAFIKSCVMAGAYLGGADSATLDNLRVYGECLGLAFQIVDDIQDVIGTKESRGKDVGGDAEAEKATYPALFGIEKSMEYAHKLIDRARDSIKEYRQEAQALAYVLQYLEEQIQ